MDPAALAQQNRQDGPMQAVAQLGHMVAQVAHATGDPRLEQAAALITDAAARPEAGAGHGLIGSAAAAPENTAAHESQLQSSSGRPPAYIDQGNRPISRFVGGSARL